MRFSSLIRMAAFGIPVVALNSSPVHAATVDSNFAAFRFSTIVTDSDLGVTANSTTTPSVNLEAPLLHQFDRNLGVLTGVSLAVNSEQSLELTGEASRIGASRNVFFGAQATTGTGTNRAIFDPLGGNRFVWGSGNLKVGSFSDNMTSSSVHCLTDCSVVPAADTSAATESASTAITGNANLNRYVGTGDVDFGALGMSWAPTSLGANISSPSANITGSATASFAWEGAISATYSYLEHARASFSDASGAQQVLTLNFGTVSRDSLASPLNFQIFNQDSAVGRTDLDYVGVASSSGDTGKFSTDLLDGFSNLLAGDGLSFFALFDTSEVGTYSATIRLRFRDALAIGASSSRRISNQLTLNLIGSVVEPVPVPASAWLFASALLGMTLVGRRESLA